LTRKEIEQIYYINREIEMWQKELERLECKSLIKSHIISDMPRGTGVSAEDMAIEKADIELVIKGLLAKLQIQRKRTLEYIESQEDSLLRQVMYLRVVSNLKWYQVGRELNITGESASKMYHRHFKRENKHDNN
jgi:hypothetical protein